MLPGFRRSCQVDSWMPTRRSNDDCCFSSSRHRRIHPQRGCFDLDLHSTNCYRPTP